MDFQKEVIEKSFDKPVVVDFWAPWCGPCQFLGSVLEELEREANGKWELVKLNVDENQDVSVKYGIRGIPDVRLFHKGDIISGFTGAIPKNQILNWLEENIPDERKEQLQKLIENLKTNNQVAELEKFVDKNPDLVEGQLALAEHYTFSEPKKASLILDKVGMQPKYLDQIESIRALIKLMNCEKDSNEKIYEKLASARTKLKSSDFDSALDLLIEAVMIDKNYCDELPRLSTIALFKVLGEKHDLTQKYRRRFNMALY